MNKLYIGISGLATSGKDLYCNIAGKLLVNKNVSSVKLAFADELKRDIDSFCKEKYNISSWTLNPEEKKLIRRMMVSHGCIMREIGDGTHWIKKIEEKSDKLDVEYNGTINVVFISDVRFPNEVHWIHSKGGWVIHVSKYTKISPDAGRTWQRVFQNPPNVEEGVNDPIVRDMADYKITWEDLSNNGGIKINMTEIVNNIYLRDEVYKSLQSCPGLSTILNAR